MPGWPEGLYLLGKGPQTGMVQGQHASIIITTRPKVDCAKLRISYLELFRAFLTFWLINRPGVARAVLQTPP